MFNAGGRSTRRAALATALSVAVLGLAAHPAMAGLTSLFDKPVPSGFRSVTGPGTLVPPYVLPSHSDVTVQSLLTTGDAGVNGYNFAGVPDALSTWKLNDSSYMVFVNHEFQTTQGVVRAHGQKGSFVSRWLFNSKGEPRSGSDLITSMQYWNGSGWQSTAPTGENAALYRLCSGSLAQPGSLRHLASNTGTVNPVYFANEEGGDNSRVFGVDVPSGVAYQLPELGRASWEIINLASGTGQKTITVGNEDGSDNGSQVWVYEGLKKRTGNVVQQAGLVGGSLSVIKVLDANGNRIVNDDAFRSGYTLGTERPFTIAAVDSSKTGSDLNAQAASVGTSLSRVEDGMFDPANPNDYWFITTSGGTKNSANLSSGGLWRLRFNDVSNPALGGTIKLVLDNSVLPRYNGGTGLAMNMPDNLVVDGRGNILIQEDPGNNAVVSRVFAYRISDGVLAEVARFDETRFTPGKPLFITQDEESSGIIDAPWLGDNTYLFDAQVHSAKELPTGTGKGTVEELVEGGQLLRMTIKSWTSIYGS